MKKWFLSVLVAVSGLLGAAEPTPWQDLYRVPIPAELPPHPRVFVTPADLARIKADYDRKDDYTVACWDKVVSDAEMALGDPLPKVDGKPSRRFFDEAALLGQAYALTGDERFARRARGLLLDASGVVMTLERTRSAGLMTDRTLEEGPVAVAFAMAYDLSASSSVFTADDHKAVCAALRRVGWEAGHWCTHMDSSNWRSWAICIEAVCGFASGDRQLIEEAVNGAWDAKREHYLYGVVQQLTHSVFSDGIHWERCMGYTYYTGTALMYAMEAAKNSGIDLWHAKLPGILGPFEGSAGHEEYGPQGDRSFKAFLDAPFFYAFPGGGFARVGDSGTASIQYHPMYELGWLEYRDPKYAWLIQRERAKRGDSEPAYWHVWRPRGQPGWEIVPLDGEDDSMGVHLTTAADERIALVQEVSVPGDKRVVFSGRVKALRMAGGKAHFRCNVGKETYFTESVTAAGDWREVRVAVPAGTSSQRRRVRLHVFLEGGAGEVLWSDIRAHAEGGGVDIVENGQFSPGRVDGRKIAFWDLVNGASDVPAGEYDLSKDATIGISGKNINGSTLFPVGGFAVLRSDPTDPAALAVNLSYGPYGSGHDHPDRLTITVHGLGETLCPDAGSWGYFNPMHLSWSNQTVAHNTVSLDEVAQAPQGVSKSIWAGEGADRRVSGTLRLFHSGRHLKAVRATCDSAYPGTVLDRTVCLVEPYLLDVYRVSSAEEHTIDLPLHGRGELTADGTVVAVRESPFKGLGYDHLQGLRQARPETLVRARFTDGERQLNVLQNIPEGGEVFLARDPSKGTEVTSCLLARRRGRTAQFVTVLSAVKGGEPVRDVVAREIKGETWVEIAHSQGTDRLVLPHRLDGAIRLERLDRSGKIVGRDIAEATK